ncbi:MAG TPA: pyridoxal-phosphate dependent enzyme [Anaerolineae bacterium]|nr:pyridoxal-phosphate dependent enzyme [Anaerolineae bacterium]
MAKINLEILHEQLENTIKRARERNIIIPTFAQMKNPELIPEKIKKELAQIGLWDINPRNLFRITWKNEPVEKGGLFSNINYLELPKSLTGVDARIIVLVGKWFPTGSHKVGATFGCLVPRLISGQFDPINQKAVWPSTGNYCRGGAYNATLLACESIAILPEGMSKERFDWLKTVAGDVIATPGTESNVKEIFDKCWELRATGEDIVIFNQFDEFGNYLWHYDITGHAMEEVLEQVLGSEDTYRGVALTTGSSGTIGCGDYIKQIFPTSKIVAGEALQCPTLMENGYGAHRIEGIGDKHVPWIHNVKNTDMIMAVDDNAVVNLARLFNEPAGKHYLESRGIPESLTSQLHLVGFSGIANIILCIKMAKYYEMGEHDVILSILTDSMELYQSRLKEMHAEYGQYTEMDAAAHFAQYLKGINVEHLQELTYTDRRRVHNLKYFTWVEQQGKTYEEIMAQWYDPNYWTDFQEQILDIDVLINDFNEKVGLL